MRHPLHQVFLLYFSPSGFLVVEILLPMILYKTADYFWLVPSEIIHPGSTYFWWQHSGDYKPIYTKITTLPLEFKMCFHTFSNNKMYTGWFRISHFFSNYFILVIIKYLLCGDIKSCVSLVCSPALPQALWRLYFLYKYGNECIINWHKSLAYNPS